MVAETRIDRPVRPAVRLIALRLLEEADDARRAWKQNDPEALHDLRVALRRLRSLVRAYDLYLDDSIRGKDRRRLKTLAAATGESRDRQVQLDILSRIDSPDEAERLALEWLLHRLRAAKRAAEDDVRRVIDDELPREHRRLARRLTRYRSVLDPEDPDAPEPTLAFLAAGLITRLGADLESRLGEVRRERDQREAHDARIAGKRLRYVIEPLRAEVPLAGAIVDRLKALQDRLGDMHDADVLCADIGALLGVSLDPAVEDGLRLLHARFATERTRQFDLAREEWLSGDPAFFAELRRLARDLRTRSAGLEIERKYLLDAMPAMPRRTRRATIDQGWLPGDRLRERVRRMRAGDGTHYFRTVKSGRGLQRIEIEEETTRRIFERLWPLTRGCRVRKRRWYREHEGYTWEIDQFLDRDLVLAEVELPSTDAVAPFPPWLEAVLVRDVTGEAAYVNLALAK